MPHDSCCAMAQASEGDCAYPDGEVVSRLRAGDETAFAELVQEWSPVMLGVARKFVGNRQSAEDVVQDAWLGILSGLADFQGRSTLRTWMFSILVKRAKSRGAREARTISWSPLDFEGGPVADREKPWDAAGQREARWASAGVSARRDTQPESAVLSGETRRLVTRALSALPPRQRRVVTLRDVRGLPAGEVCAALGISPQNQRVLLHRGRAVLRSALAGYYRG